mgnify:CR=1 FL=1
MTTTQLIQELVDAQRDAGKDPQFTIGYLMAFLAQVDGMNTKKNQAITRSDLQHAIDIYKQYTV